MLHSQERSGKISSGSQRVGQAIRPQASFHECQIGRWKFGPAVVERLPEGGPALQLFSEAAGDLTDSFG